MPELMMNYCRQVEGRAVQLEQLMAGAKEQLYDIKKELNNSPDRGCDAGDAMLLQSATTPKKSSTPRAKESSKHFGVRFRPDLQKWVAEIRVAEWKTVDKKVWLGTFDSEEGAARAVDAARKLLNCKKKRPPNFPCDALRQYSQSIPPHLNLTNLHDDSMFKDVTLFIKRKAKEYAAAGVVSPSKASSSSSSSCLPISSAPRFAHGLYTSEAGELRYDAPSAEDVGVVSRHEISRHEFFPDIDARCHWSNNNPTSVHCYSDEPASCSTSAGTSLESSVCYYGISQAVPSFVQMEGDDGDGWVTTLPGPSSQSESWSDPMMEIDDGQYPLLESSLWNVCDDLVFPFEDDYDRCHVHGQTVMDIFHRDEMIYGDGQNSDNWTSGPLLQQNFNLCNSVDYTPVC